MEFKQVDGFFPPKPIDIMTVFNLKNLTFVLAISFPREGTKNSHRPDMSKHIWDSFPPATLDD